MFGTDIRIGEEQGLVEDVALEKDGPSRVQASCHTPVTPGSYIYTHTDKMNRLRKNIVELVMTDYPREKFENDLPEKNELKKVAMGVGLDMDGVRYTPGRNHFHRNGDNSHPYMRSDLSACINCYRCVRACDEVQGELVPPMEGRGSDIAPNFSLIQSHHSWIFGGIW